MCEHFTGEWEAEALKIELACPQAVYNVRSIKKSKYRLLSAGQAPFLMGGKTRKKEKTRKGGESIFCLCLLQKTWISGSMSTYISYTLPSPRESWVFFVSMYSGEKVVMCVYTQVCSCADGRTSNKNGYSYKPSCFPIMAATWLNVPVFKVIKRPFKGPLKGLETSKDQTPGMN